MTTIVPSTNKNKPYCIYDIEGQNLEDFNVDSAKLCALYHHEPGTLEVDKTLEIRNRGLHKHVLILKIWEPGEIPDDERGRIVVQKIAEERRLH